MSIISTFARDNVAEILSEDEPTMKELKKFTHEVCHAYNLNVIRVEKGSRTVHADLLTENGITAGAISVERNSEYFIYRTMFPTINKERASARSPSSERDSKKINTLMRAIKKNKEEPTNEAIINLMKRSMLEPFNALSARYASTPSISIPQKIQVAAMNFVLGVDTVSMNMYIDELKSLYSKHQSELQLYAERNTHADRFKRGSTLIGLVPRSKDPHYLVADVSVDSLHEMTFHTPLKRYSTLKELPIAPVVMMINTFMQSTSGYDKENELGLPYRDTYYHEIDIATGYSSGSQPLWVAIPKEAP